MEVISIRRYRFITFENRKNIEELHNIKGLMPKEIAIEMDIPLSGIYRELKRGEVAELNSFMNLKYSAVKAHMSLSKSKNIDKSINVSLEDLLKS